MVTADKSGIWGMWCHQAASFAPPLMRVSRREAVFWPGCALMQLDPSILGKTAEILRRVEPELGFSSCCCGQPTRYLMEEKYIARRDRISNLLAKRGVRRVYAACPNCIRQLQEYGEVEIRSIWPVLAGCIRREDISGSVSAVVIHDPCPLRNQPAGQAAVRNLLDIAGVQVVEPEHTREKTVCCGNIQMLRTRDPQKSERIRCRRMAEFPPGLPIASCCEGCLDAFRSEGADTLHLLEILFGKSRERGWGNRLAFTCAVK